MAIIYTLGLCEAGFLASSKAACISPCPTAFPLLGTLANQNCLRFPHGILRENLTSDNVSQTSAPKQNDFLQYLQAQPLLPQGGGNEILRIFKTREIHLFFTEGVVLAQREVLCESCAAIDFDKIFRKKVKFEVGEFVTNITSSLSDLKISDCAMCRLFTSVAPKDEHEQRDDTVLCLRASSAARVFMGSSPAKRSGPDTTVLGVVDVSKEDCRLGRNQAAARVNNALRKTGCLYTTHIRDRSIKMKVNLIDSKDFDTEYARHCMDYCKANHGEICKRDATGPSLSPFFRVTDCKTGAVVKAPPNCDYAALSYVWGDSVGNGSSQDVGLQKLALLEYPEGSWKGITDSVTGAVKLGLGYNLPGLENSSQGSVLAGCPKVITDSVIAVMKLGLRYMWVDGLCIDQLNAHEKHVQISQMDLIYARAQITIIAATENPNDGLPGVVGSRGKIQPKVHLGGYTIASSLPHPQTLMARSKCITRGCTYQEGILSKRRLIFTDEKTLFECKCMHCTESLSLPLDSMHQTLGKGRFKKHIPEGPLGMKVPGMNPWDIIRCISEFSKRDLSYAEDRINAMGGIFHAFEKGPQPLYNIMGMDGQLFETVPGMETFNDTYKVFDAEVWVDGDDKQLMPFPSLEAFKDVEIRDLFTNQRFIHLKAYTISCYPVDIVQRMGSTA
ncbi:hypothetical protein IFR05_010426 [Cadophora sp. M221]|nr:hypothetical protein IFR05_010426 [Cadophora sp. M221]